METEEVNQLKQVLNSNLEQLVQNQKNLQEISSYYQKLYSTQNAIDYEQTNTQARQYVIQGLNLILYQINILTKGISDYMVYQNSITDSIDFELNTINHVIFIKILSYIIFKFIFKNYNPFLSILFIDILKNIKKIYFNVYIYIYMYILKNNNNNQ